MSRRTTKMNCPKCNSEDITKFDFKKSKEGYRDGEDGLQHTISDEIPTGESNRHCKTCNHTW